jgi:ABC-type uncharacterized transport system permease subunit
MTLPALSAMVLYLLTGFLALRREPVTAERWLALAAITLQAAVLFPQILQGQGLALGVSEALSLLVWLTAALLWTLSWREPLRTLGVGIYPLAAATVLLPLLWPTALAESPLGGWRERLHIILALFSAGLLTLAAVQSVLLAVQDQLLHRHTDNRVVRALPPLLTMERVLFQLVAIGFVLLSATLLTGLWFLEDWLRQHLAHKTVLSITAWLLFGVLLWGRWRHGWRGRAAIRWSLSGYGMLILAYFGSKIILEQILGRHWS